MSVVITVAPTGPIATKADNPSLPTTPEEIAKAAGDAYSLGASVAHVHLRDEQERPTLVELRPRMATLNPCSMSFGEGEFRNPPTGVRRLATRMRELGVKPELEIYDTGHLDACLRLRDEGLLDEPLQFSIVLGVRGGMAATPENLLTMVRRLPEGAIWQVIAVGRASLPLTAVGLAIGGNARAGMEDTIHLAKGKLTDGNDPLVQRAVGLAHDLGMEVAGTDGTEKLLQLPRPIEPATS